jgi:hypothetical protein
MLNTVNVNPALPWELNPALRQERLEALAHVAVATRNRAFAEADRDAGDTNWGLACKAHERLMHTLTRLVSGGAHPWLSIVRDGLYLMPLIEGVPIRLFRGASDRVSSRHLDAVRLEHERWQAAEGGAPQMAFEFMAGSTSDGPWYWLMAMETDAAGMVVRVVYFQANDAGETRHAWPCALPPAEAPEQAAQNTKPSQVVRLADKRGGRRQAKQAPTEARQDARQEGFWGALGAE